jgi:hypothetical protein
MRFCFRSRCIPIASGTPVETRDLWPAVTLNATAQGDFGGLAALERNRIFELRGTEPDFLMEFRTKLQQRRWIESDTVCFFKSHTTLVIENCHRTLRLCFLRVMFPGFDNYFQDAPTGVGQETRLQQMSIVASFRRVFRRGLEGRKMSSKRRMSGGSLTSWGGTSIRFSVQGKGMHCGRCHCSIICSGGYICCSRGDWPFKLIVSVE